MIEGERDRNGAFDAALEEARAAGFNTVRFFAHGSDVGDALQTAPGKYDR